ncbi:MAG: hypothetical protein IJW48_00120 [Clostridia bacterium]|nr:hypothetical protein [Clostridia bacterium]
MKKYLSIFVILTLTLSILSLSSCEVFSKDRTLSIGVYESVVNGELTETVAAIVTEEDGTIVLCRLDAVTYSPAVDAYGEPIIAVPKTVSEQGGTVYEQMRRFEEYAVGKTVGELLEEFNPSDSSPYFYETSADYVLLIPGFISPGHYAAAIERADKNEYKTAFRSKNLECAVAMFLEPSAPTFPEPSTDKSTMSLTLTGSFAAVAASGGKIAGAIIDANEVVLTVTHASDGTLTVIEKSSQGTKLEQGEDYGMDDYNPYAIGDWYEQAGAYVKALGGIKTEGLETELPENTAGCTIDTDSYRAALKKAAARTK